MPTSEFRPDPRLFPFESRWLDREAGRIHYLDEGEGPPLLFLHGNPTWSFLYRGAVIRLRNAFRCLALDYPGFGLSAHPAGYRYTPEEHAEVVLDFVRTLGLEELTIVGHDWGGPIGLSVAVREPRRVKALVMGNTWFSPIEALHLRAFSWILSTGYMQGFILRKESFVDRLISLGIKHPLAPEVLEHYRGPFPTPDSRAGVAEFVKQLTLSTNWLARLEEEVRELLAEIPLLLAWGIDDLAFTPAFMDRFLAVFSNARSVRLDARHFVQEDAPGPFSEAIRTFLTA